MRWALWIARVGWDAHAAAQCVVGGRAGHLSGAEVRVAGIEPFLIDVASVEVRTQIPDGIALTIPVRIRGRCATPS
jgi:hypothetical protein